MSAPDSLSMDFDLPHPPEKVWRALTDPALLSAWLLPVIGFKLEAGAAFRFQTQAFPGWDGAIDCRLLEIEPGRKLRYSWRVPDMDTIVTFTLTPTDAGTHLALVQSGFKPHNKRELGGARYGWAMMAEKLATLLGGLP